MKDDSEQSGDGIERGPNGFPYIDLDRSSISAWESGDFHLKVKREDGEMVRINLNPDHIRALEDGLRETRERAVEKPEVDYDG